MKAEYYIEIYDFETTDLFEPEPTQIGLVGANKDLEMLSANSEYIKPKGSISFPAMGITGITPETVKDADPEEVVLSGESWFSPDEDSTYVASYNWNFDKKFIPESWLVGKKVLCILKLAKTLVDKEKTGDHKLSTLWYYYGHYKTKNYGNAHDAKWDCQMTLDVLKSILEENNLTLDEAWEMLYDIKVCKGGKKYRNQKWLDIIQHDYDYVQYTVNQASIDDEEELGYLVELLSKYSHLKEEQMDIVGFGKYQGSSWRDLVKSDSGYVNWCLNNLDWRSADVKEYVKGLVKVDTTK